MLCPNILVKPKNALVKQYGKLLEMDGVKLHFDEEALHLIAKEALERKTGWGLELLNVCVEIFQHNKEISISFF